MKNASKILALLLAVMMVVCMFAGCAKDNGTAESNTPAGGTTASNGGTASSGTDGEPDVDVEEVDDGTYTYNYAMSVFPTNWNPHIYQTNDDSEILGYISAGFYTFDYNEELDGYKVIPDMAAEEPIDVTADYIGQYGLTEDSYSQAYIIKLRSDLAWQDGTPITANDFVESAKRLLAPAAQNYRADSLYSGNMVIYNSEAYLKAGTYAYGEFVSANYGDDEYVPVDQFTVKEDGTLAVGDADIVLNVNSGGNWGSNSLSDYYGAGYFENDLWETIVAAADENGYVALTQEYYDALCDIIAVLHGAADAAEYAGSAGDYAYQEIQEMLFLGKTYPEMSWDEVGMFAKSDDELVIVLTKPLSGFYLLYSLTDSWLVNTKLYDSCESIADGVYSNTYGTSVETTLSYGPYILTTFQADKEFSFEKNPYYFGYNDEYDVPTYQTTNVVVQFVPEASTRLEMFIQGKLDGYGLTVDDMEKYSRSDYTYYNPGDSTFFMAFNPDLDALVAMQEAAGANINKSIIAIDEFRMAMSFAMNRADFCLATSPTNNAAFAVYSELIVSNPEEGTGYRTTDEAKQVIVNFWGLADDIGDGKLYEDADEAIASVTGYNPTKAAELFDAAYDKAIELGYMDEDDIVEIKVGTPNGTSTFYNNGYNYIVNNYTEAVKGTKLEGKLTFTRDDTLGNGFSDALKANQVDMLFGVGWTGSALDPYNLMEAYTSSAYQYDPAWDTTTAPLTIDVKGEEYTASVWDWTLIMMGETCTVTKADGTTLDYSCGEADNDPETRLHILGALENAVLMTYDMIPLMDDSSASMKGQKIEYYTEEYVFGMGHGGVKYYTYNYNDEEWADFVASQNGELDYN